MLDVRHLKSESSHRFNKIQQKNKTVLIHGFSYQPRISTFLLWITHKMVKLIIFTTLSLYLLR